MPLTVAITLVDAPPNEKARIATVLGLLPSLMNLPLPAETSLRPRGALRIAEVLPLVCVRQDAQDVAGAAAPANPDAHERLRLQLLGPAADGGGGHHPLIGVLRGRVADDRRAVGAGVGLPADPDPEGLVAHPLALALGAADLLEGVHVVLALEGVAARPGSARLRRSAGHEGRAGDEQGCQLGAHAGVSVAVGLRGDCKNTLTPRWSGQRLADR